MIKYGDLSIAHTHLHTIRMFQWVNCGLKLRSFFSALLGVGLGLGLSFHLHQPPHFTCWNTTVVIHTPECAILRSAYSHSERSGEISVITRIVLRVVLVPCTYSSAEQWKFPLTAQALITFSVTPTHATCSRSAPTFFHTPLSLIQFSDLLRSHFALQ